MKILRRKMRPIMTITSMTIPRRTIPRRTIPRRTIPRRTIPRRMIPRRTIPRRMIPRRQRTLKKTLRMRMPRLIRKLIPRLLKLKKTRRRIKLTPMRKFSLSLQDS
jgi:hypothetical protein